MVLCFWLLGCPEPDTAPLSAPRTDVDCDDADKLAWTLDADQDGFGAGPNQFRCPEVDLGPLGYARTDGDCDDLDSRMRPGQPELCGSGLDDDCDGHADCDDADCDCPEPWTAPTTEDCGNGVDDDQDGNADCADAECMAACLETVCDDGLDGDEDGFIDCADVDCWPVCDLTTLRLDGGSVAGRRTDVRVSGPYLSRLSEDASWTVTDATGVLEVTTEGLGESCAWSADKLDIEGHAMWESVDSYGGGVGSYDKDYELWGRVQVEGLSWGCSVSPVFPTLRPFGRDGAVETGAVFLDLSQTAVGFSTSTSGSSYQRTNSSTFQATVVPGEAAWVWR